MTAARAARPRKVLKPRGRWVAPCSRCAGGCGGGVFGFSWGQRALCLDSREDRRHLIERLGPCVSPAASMVLRTLVSYEIKAPVSWVSNEKLTSDCAYHSKQTILTARMALRQMGLLSWRNRYDHESGQQTTNLHTIHWRRILELYVYRDEAPKQIEWEPFSAGFIASLPPEAVRGLRLVVPEEEPKFSSRPAAVAALTPAVAAAEDPSPTALTSPANALTEVTATPAPVEAANQNEVTPVPPPVVELQGALLPSTIWAIWRALFEKKYRSRYLRNGAMDDKFVRELCVLGREAVDAQLAVPGERASRVQLTEQFFSHLFSKFLASPGHKEILRERRHPLYLLRSDLSSFGSPWKLGQPSAPPPPPPELLRAPVPTPAPSLATPAVLSARMLATLAPGAPTSTPHPGAPEASTAASSAVISAEFSRSPGPVAPFDQRPEVPDGVTGERVKAPAGTGVEGPGAPEGDGALRRGVVDIFGERPGSADSTNMEAPDSLTSTTDERSREADGLLDERVERALSRWREVLGGGLLHDAAREASRRRMLRERLVGGLTESDLERVWIGAQEASWREYARMMRIAEPGELLELLKPGRWGRFLTGTPG